MAHTHFHVWLSHTAWGASGGVAWLSARAAEQLTTTASAWFHSWWWRRGRHRCKAMLPWQPLVVHTCTGQPVARPGESEVSLAGMPSESD